MGFQSLSGVEESFEEGVYSRLVGLFKHQSKSALKNQAMSLDVKPANTLKIGYSTVFTKLNIYGFYYTDLLT